MQPQPKNRGAGVILFFAIVGFLVFASTHYQEVLDQYALSTFHPGTEVASIEGHLSLTNAARAMLYRSEPQVDDKSAFNADCNTRPHELELGCYFGNRIFVLRIDNDSLASEMDVVAAHELLHAAWVRMPESERRQVAAELSRVYEGLGDQDLRQRMAGYSQTEPGEETNELHSILGTEYANLSPFLEKHYAKYFADRSRIVAAHAAYKQVFDARRDQLDSELTVIKQEKVQLTALNQQMESLKATGRISQYNSMVTGQNSLVDDINKRISEYRAGVDEYNALSKSVDSQAITETDIAPAQ